MSASLHDPEPLLAPPQEAAGAEAGVDFDEVFADGGLTPRTLSA